jgi:hypothetical protein
MPTALPAKGLASCEKEGLVPPFSLKGNAAMKRIFTLFLILAALAAGWLAAAPAANARDAQIVFYVQ